jgi:hypothetical protein
LSFKFDRGGREGGFSLITHPIFNLRSFIAARSRLLVQRRPYRLFTFIPISSDGKTIRPRVILLDYNVVKEKNKRKEETAIIITTITREEKREIKKDTHQKCLESAAKGSEHVSVSLLQTRDR